jgi:hypothetical protein
MHLVNLENPEILSHNAFTVATRCPEHVPTSLDSA